MPEQDLLKLKQAVDNAIKEEDQLVGQRKQLAKSLKEDFNCKTIEESEQYLFDIQNQIKTKEELLEKGVIELKEKLGWG